MMPFMGTQSVKLKVGNMAYHKIGYLFLDLKTWDHFVFLGVSGQDITWIDDMNDYTISESVRVGKLIYT